MPDKRLQEAHATFEECRYGLGDENPNSILMHVYTGVGVKEWCYYAKDYPTFMEELNAALSDKPQYPIQILHDDDPTWEYWTSSIMGFAMSPSDA